jgi:hypothetical protein
VCGSTKPGVTSKPRALNSLDATIRDFADGGNLAGIDCDVSFEGIAAAAVDLRAAANDKVRHGSQPQLAGQPVALRQVLELFPRGVFHGDAVPSPLLLALELDLAGIQHLGEALCRRSRLQVLGKLGDLLLERVEIPERGDVEYRDEAAVVVTARRFYAVAKAGKQT